MGGRKIVIDLKAHVIRKESKITPKNFLREVILQIRCYSRTKAVSALAKATRCYLVSSLCSQKRFNPVFSLLLSGFPHPRQRIRVSHHAEHDDATHALGRGESSFGEIRGVCVCCVLLGREAGGGYATVVQVCFQPATLPRGVVMLVLRWVGVYMCFLRCEKGSCWVCKWIVGLGYPILTKLVKH